MSIFDFNKGKEQVANEGTVPEGTYEGKVIESKLMTTKLNHKQVVLKIKTSGGIVRLSLNLEHPAAKDIAHKDLFKLLVNGYKNPPMKLETFEDVAKTLIQLPVKLKITHLGENKDGYTDYRIMILERDEASKVNYSVAGSAF